jgi:hypothetical protein
MVPRREVLGLLGLLAAPGFGRAEEMAVFRIEMKDGVITPSRLAVPADRPFKIEIANAGRTPAEFESTELYKEKVLAPGAVSSIVFRRLEPGEYVFFDDFHPGARLVLEAK